MSLSLVTKHFTAPNSFSFLPSSEKVRMLFVIRQYLFLPCIIHRYLIHFCEIYGQFCYLTRLCVLIRPLMTKIRRRKLKRQLHVRCFYKQGQALFRFLD